MSDRADRDLDIVVYGATGFVGRLTAEHLAAHAPAGVRIGLAGRSKERLAQVRDDLGAAAAEWPLVVADAGDRAAVRELAERTRVVATTVGPYARYGMPLVEACAEVGTDYADLTGEVLFVRDSIDRCHERAAVSGARIVHSCGFDSIPSDLAALLAFERARDDDAGELTDTTMLLISARGGLSGGTIDSMRTLVDTVRADLSHLRTMRDPYALSPDREAEPDLGDERDQTWVRREPELGVWTGPFMMAAHNTRIVRRSNALLGWSYGRRFRYREAVAFRGGPVAPVLAGGMALGLGAAVAGMALPPTRFVLDRVLPDPGEGPSEETMRTGHFRMDLHAQTTSGTRYLVEVAAKGDPGYAATAVMLAGSALCLALDRDRLPDLAGVLTPASGIGSALADRLRDQDFLLDVRRR
jgi:short subunit dehydrogenase-like uncharacterized protein